MMGIGIGIGLEKDINRYRFLIFSFHTVEYLKRLQGSNPKTN